MFQKISWYHTAIKIDMLYLKVEGGRYIEDTYVVRSLQEKKNT